ncbi:hypothetical protein V1503_19430 [Bacillus sp. SCS-151]|uniref:hypothetical protein n=1 Tax=Nanhaiella sioensis TaxID=3115293 RepID=UPI00397C02A7
MKFSEGDKVKICCVIDEDGVYPDKYIGQVATIKGVDTRRYYPYELEFEDKLIEKLGNNLWAGEELNGVHIQDTKDKLYSSVIQFMKENKVTSEETIHQCDWVIENAADFINKLFEIVKPELELGEI